MRFNESTLNLLLTTHVGKLRYQEWLFTFIVEILIVWRNSDLNVPIRNRYTTHLCRKTGNICLSLYIVEVEVNILFQVNLGPVILIASFYEATVSLDYYLNVS